MKILVVGDDLGTRNQIEAALREGGVEVTASSGWSDASARVADRVWPVVVVDCRGAVDDSLQLCRGIRKRAPRESSYVLVVAAPEHIESLLEAGADDYVRAPIDARELALRVRLACARVRERADQRRVQETLAHNAFHDPLTGLPNRALFMDRLYQAAERVRRRGGFSYAVLFIDVDRFKHINDTWGHDAGDDVLIEIGERLEQCLRPGDTIARIGGDEFTVLMEGVREPRDALKVADRVLRELGRPFERGDVVLDASASVGIALSTSNETAHGEVLKAADAALYRAKSAGRGRRELYDAAMQDQADAALEIEEALRTAIERAEFRLHYQPIVEVATGEISGFEALLRWEHPQRGLLSPEEFLNVAVDSGLMLPIGWWTLEEATRQIEEWHASDFSTAAVGVNLSRREFLHAELPQRLDDLLTARKLDASSLWLEITEETISHPAGDAASRILELGKLGIRVFLDDFGRGLSSFSHLHQCPLDTVKIDGAFTVGLDAQEGVEGAVLGSMVAVAQALGMRTVVEGVETQGQLKALAPLGSDMAQGYLFSEPLPPSDAVKLLDRAPVSA